MRGRPLGGSGIQVAKIGLGGMPLSLAGRPSESVAIQVIHEALDAGMTLIDTADVYCIDDDDIGHNEALIRKALHTWKGTNDITVATKGGLERPEGDWVVNGAPSHLKTACERSLKALGVDTITVYQLHAPDDEVPFADSVGALADLQREGKIRHIGLSNVSVSQIREAQRIAPIVSVQNRCSPLDRSPFRDGIVAYCETSNIAFLAYSPVGGSRGKFRVAEDPTLSRIGEKLGATPYQVALAWLLACSPVVVPIPGASRVESAIASAKAMDLELDANDTAELDRAFPRS